MIKQKLTLSAGIISLLLGSLVAFPHRANAGQVVVPGTTPDSSFIGIFSVTTITTTVVQGLSEVFSSPNNPGSGFIFLEVTQRIQIALNTVASNLFSQTTVTTIRGEVRELFARRGIDTVTVTNRTRTNWLSHGVRETRIDTLLVTLSQVCIVIRASAPGSPVAQLTPELVASTKGLKADSTIAQAQAGDLATVDINKLNEAIEAYNAIVKESDPVTLQKLSQDETFLEIGRILKEFRAALA